MCGVASSYVGAGAAPPISLASWSVARVAGGRWWCPLAHQHFPFTPALQGNRSTCGGRARQRDGGGRCRAWKPCLLLRPCSSRRGVKRFAGLAVPMPSPLPCSRAWWSTAILSSLGAPFWRQASVRTSGCRHKGVACNRGFCIPVATPSIYNQGGQCRCSVLRPQPRAPTTLPIYIPAVGPTSLTTLVPPRPGRRRHPQRPRLPAELLGRRRWQWHR